MVANVAACKGVHAEIGASNGIATALRLAASDASATLARRETKAAIADMR